MSKCKYEDTKVPVCPYCGHREKDWENSMAIAIGKAEEVECSACEEVFVLQVDGFKFTSFEYVVRNCGLCEFFVKDNCEQLQRGGTSIPDAVMIQSLLYETTASSGSQCDTFKAKP